MHPFQLESILFGHRKGSFTSADKDSEGLILQADKGTLFMDEVGELELPMQKTFLRVLQERRFCPVGGSSELKCDFRLVTATNKDIVQMVRTGDFRNDLYFRIKGATAFGCRL